MINSTDVAAADLLLHNADFPDNYVNMQHPEDYDVVDEPFTEYLPHFSGHNNRLIVRICWKTPGGRYVPMSFVCDTGAPMGLYLSEKAVHVLRKCGRIMEDETGNEHVTISNIGKAAIEPTPPGHAPVRGFSRGTQDFSCRANIIGLRVLVKLALRINDNWTFVLDRMPRAF